MRNVYISECNIEIAQGPGRPRIIMGKEIPFATTDRAVQRVLNTYPRVKLVSSEPEPASRPLSAAEGLALHGPAPEPVRVSAGGLQMKEPKAR